MRKRVALLKVGMLRVITCSRCGQDAEPLAKPPLAGSVGQAVQAHVCPSCWNEWQRTAPSYINHHNIQIVEPAGRAQLYAFMRDFLNVPADA